MDSQLLHTFFTNAESWADRDAIVDKDGRTYSFDQLLRSTAHVQERIDAYNLQSGDLVVVAVPMSFKLYPILLGMVSKGVICVFLDPWFSIGQLNRLIGELDPKLVVLDKKFRALSLVIPALWRLNKWFVGELETSAKKLTTPILLEDGTALVTYTSGTSGKPKGANRTLGFLSAQIDALSGYLQRDGFSRDYTNFPVVGLGCLYYGNTVIVPDLKLKAIHKAKASQVIDQIKKAKTTRLIVSPAILDVIDAPIGISEVITGGAPLTEELAERTLGMYGDCKLTNLYGSTESEPIASIDFEAYVANFKNDFGGLLAGRVYEKTKLKLIATDQVGMVEVSSGEVGEIVVAGDHVNKGYFRNEAAFAENKFNHGGEIWHRTNDTGYLKDGLLFLVGSRSRIIRRGGEMYHPFPVEHHVRKACGLNDVAYFERDGKVCLVFHGESDEAAIKRCLETQEVVVDHVISYPKPLPKDPRHRGKVALREIKLDL